MRIVLLAPPGAGKGTQGKRLSDTTAFRTSRRVTCCASTSKTAPKLAVTSSGRSIPAILCRRWCCGWCRKSSSTPETNGYILDGYPRTVNQAIEGREAAERIGMGAQAAVFLDADESELIRRVLLRAEEEGREDDTEDVIRHRLATYKKETEPVIEHYRNRGMLIEVDGMQPIEDVTRDILGKLAVMKTDA